MGVEITEVRSRSELKDWVTFPNRLYRGDPRYVPQLIGQEIDFFDRAKNPSFKIAQTRLLAARRDGRTVGRVCGIMHGLETGKLGHRRGRFGWFECAEDPEAAAALLGALESWFRAAGCREMTGPHGFTDLDPEGMLVEGFVITTLDAAVRLNRYLFEELWAIVFKNPPRLLKHYWFNAGLSVLVMWSLAYSNAFNTLWPIFGTANQLLAALALLAVSAWLLLRKKKKAFTLIPAIFMLVTTIASLLILMGNYVRTKNYILIGADVLMLVLSVGVVWLVAKTFLRRTEPVAGPVGGAGAKLEPAGAGRKT